MADIGVDPTAKDDPESGTVVTVVVEQLSLADGRS
jgi:hypothetical protein